MSLNTDLLLRDALREKLKITDETTLKIVTAVAAPWTFSPPCLCNAATI
jgi:hypothetical protein